MRLCIVIAFLTVAAKSEDVSRVVQPNEATESNAVDLSDTELLQAFVVFRHGDRTPDEDELKLYSSEQKIDKEVFFPFGIKALTNKGKQRGYSVGKYLRMHYDGLISRIYLPDEIQVRTTSYARTKMTALTALAALYPPQPAQKWNPALNWQPVPYNTPEWKSDDMLYYYNCPRYIKMRNDIYQDPQVVEWMKPYDYLYGYLKKHTGNNITMPVDIFYMDNLFQTLNNVGFKTPQWALEVMPQMKEVSKIEYASEYFNTELIRLSVGVLMRHILNVTSSYIDGHTDQPKLWLYSAHENNVAALMAGSRAFLPHQPKYGSTFSLELRRVRSTGQFGFTAMYASEAGGPAQILPVAGCDSLTLCDYNKFTSLVKEFTMSLEDYKKECQL